MCGRGFRILLLVFEALWLNVIVPGHHRGAVPLPGEECAACQTQVADCCPEHSGHRAPPAKPRGDPAQHCAICYFSARLCPPPAIDFSPPPLRLIAQLPFPAPHIRDAAPFIPSYYGRAPPQARLHLT
jgi:hypothetical protein